MGIVISRGSRPEHAADVLRLHLGDRIPETTKKRRDAKSPDSACSTVQGGAPHGGAVSLFMGSVRALAPDARVSDHRRGNRARALLGRKISELGLGIAGTRVERLVDAAVRGARGERPRLPAAGLSQRPVGMSRRHAADRRSVLSRRRAARANRSGDVGGVEDDDEAMRYMRHEAGHAVNYAFRLYDRADGADCSASFSRPYRERYRADPFSRDTSGTSSAGTRRSIPTKISPRRSRCG